MERYAWKARLKPGMRAEYTKRHAEIWPEMVELLHRAGIVNYTIFVNEEELFGYYECTQGAAYAAQVQAESAVVDRWNEYMQDVMEMPLDPVTGAQPHLEEAWHLD